MKRNAWVVFLALVVVLLGTTACFPESKPNMSEVSQEEFLLRLSTDKRTYKLGEEVIITAYVENLTDEPVKYDYGVDGRIGIGIDKKPHDPNFNSVWFNLNDEVTWGFMIMIAYGDTLGPGESITRQVVWNQVLYSILQEALTQVPPGEYTIGAHFDGGWPDVLKTSVTVEIEE